MKNDKSPVIQEKDPQQLFEEIQNQDLSTLSISQLRERMRIVHNAMNDTLIRQSEILSKISDGFQLIA